MTWTYGEYDYNGNSDFSEEEFEKYECQFHEAMNDCPVYIVLKQNGKRMLGIATVNGLLEVPYKGGDNE